jgi:hypothetical protein
MIPQHEHARFALEDLPDDIRAQIPHLGNFGHCVMALLKARRRRLV